MREEGAVYCSWMSYAISSGWEMLMILLHRGLFFLLGLRHRLFTVI